MAEAKTFMIEDAHLVFKNFAGKEGPFNDKGVRSVTVILPEDLALQMLEDGWNVKQLRSREEGEEGDWSINCVVSFKIRPPRIVMISSRARTNLGEDGVDVLDYADLRTVDILCRGYEWTVNDKSGVKAYVQSLFATVEEDELERKYAINNPEV